MKKNIIFIIIGLFIMVGAIELLYAQTKSTWWIYLVIALLCSIGIAFIEHAVDRFIKKKNLFSVIIALAFGLVFFSIAITNPFNLKVAEIQGKIQRINAATSRGYTTYYLTVEGKDELKFRAAKSLSDELPFTKEGDMVVIKYNTYMKGDTTPLKSFDNLKIR